MNQRKLGDRCRPPPQRSIVGAVCNRTELQCTSAVTNRTYHLNFVNAN
jgi:hypothetical protein